LVELLRRHRPGNNPSPPAMIAVSVVLYLSSYCRINLDLSISSKGEVKVFLLRP
jgi:hypothetical protein